MTTTLTTELEGRQSPQPESDKLTVRPPLDNECYKLAEVLSSSPGEGPYFSTRLAHGFPSFQDKRFFLAFKVLIRSLIVQRQVMCRLCLRDNYQFCEVFISSIISKVRSSSLTACRTKKNSGFSLCSSVFHCMLSVIL